MAAADTARAILSASAVTETGPADAARRVLSVASECVPLLKTGGLADVVGALPAALEPWGWDTRVLLPGYRQLNDLLETARRAGEPLWQADDLFGGPARVYFSQVEGLDVLLLDAPHLFDREGGPYSVDGYDQHDNHVRFAALSWAGSELAVHGCADGWRPDVVHAHDWQAGLVPSYLKYAGSNVPSVMTIHNIAFQGIFGADQLDRLRLPTWDFHPDALEYHGVVSALKAGMVHASVLTTVSPSYAQELTRPEFGFGLEGVVTARRDRGELRGILNGIDTEVWDPAADTGTIPYSALQTGPKQQNRRALLKEFGLTEPEGPLAVVITRLTHQKGVDLLLQALPEFVAGGGAVVVLGSGDAGYEEGLRHLAAQHPQSVGVRIGYDEALSHRMFAGGDVVLVPSRFEPCGLTQLYGLRYGTVPVVASTGGLRDTVTDPGAGTPLSSSATGFVFGEPPEPIDAEGLLEALFRAQQLYTKKRDWRQMRRQAMSTPVGWQDSASKYAVLFDSLLV